MLLCIHFLYTAAVLFELYNALAYNIFKQFVSSGCVVFCFSLELVADGATEQNHLFLPPSSFPLPGHPVEAFLNAGGDDDQCVLARYQTRIINILQVLLSVHLCQVCTGRFRVNC